MNRLRRPSVPIRLLLAALLALCLGVRLLTPAGFMPSFASGSLAIVPCPDAEGAPPIAAMPAMAAMPGMVMPEPAHDHGDHGFHPSCPYASAASLAGIDTGTLVLAFVVLLAVLPPRARALLAFRRRATRERPPSQGPPLPT